MCRRSALALGAPGTRLAWKLAYAGRRVAGAFRTNRIVALPGVDAMRLRPVIDMRTELKGVACEEQRSAIRARAHVAGSRVGAQRDGGSTG